MRVRNKYAFMIVATWVPCIALGVASYLFALEPQMRRVNALEMELTDARRLYSRAVEAARPENQLRLTQEAQKLNDRVADFILLPETAPDLAFEIAELASTTEVESFMMKPQDRAGLETVPNCDKVGERLINVAFTSHFHQFVTLLNALERHRPVLFIETFAITRPRQEAEKPRIDMQLAVLVEKSRSS